MEYKGIIIPDRLERVERINLGVLNGDDYYVVDPDEMAKMIQKANCITGGQEYKLHLYKDEHENSIIGGLIVDAVITIPETEDEMFDRIAEQMGNIDKNHN